MTTSVDAVVADTFHREWGRIVASLIRITGDWDLAEECAQDAFEKALARWPNDGIPARPGAWITTAARHRAIDRLRRGSVEASKLRELVQLAAPADDMQQSDIPDDRLRLLFTCCHPALALDARVALTLRTLTGMTTAEIARGCLVPEGTMAKRLVRAKAKIRNAAIPYRVPSADLLPARMSGVMAVLYLLFNEGYTASAGTAMIRSDFCDEAVRLARMLVQLMPTEPEPKGLLALMLLHDSRREARVDEAGEPITLEDQDRSRWHRDKIDEGVNVLEDALDARQVGPYQLQAMIAALHATSPTPEATDWRGVVRLYRQLLQVVPSPVVELNHAIAVAMADGPEAGLLLLAELEATDGLRDYHLLPAARADLLRRLGRDEEAAGAYREAIAMVRTGPERGYLERRLQGLGRD